MKIRKVSWVPSWKLLFPSKLSHYHAPSCRNGTVKRQTRELRYCCVRYVVYFGAVSRARPLIL